LENLVTDDNDPNIQPDFFQSLYEMKSMEELVCRPHILRLLTSQRESILADLKNGVAEMRKEMQGQQAVLSTHNAVDLVRSAKQNESIVRQLFFYIM